jgi:tRNA(fMet)-specific endonuclease VapC
MTPKFMLDTNMCIYLMKHHPPEVAEQFARCYFGEVVISAISLAELEYGVVCSGTDQEKNRLALASLLEDLAVAPFDQDAAKAYGPVRLAARERSKDALDKLIAAHAIALKVTLITNNVADFTRYPGLLLENWVK